MAAFFSHVYNQIATTNIWTASKPFLCMGRPGKVSDNRPKRLTAGAAAEKMDVDDRNQFWRSTKYDVDYWQTYLDARPKYERGDFYQRLLDYHRSHQSDAGAWPTIAHDVGTGPGQVAAVLAKNFDQVVASDLNSTHLEVAYHMLKLGSGKNNITLTNAGGEKLINHFPESSAALVTAAECMPLMDIPSAVDAWSRLLKPDGTLAMWFYGRPAFDTDDPTFDGAACNTIYEEVASRAFRPFYDVQGPRLENVRKAMDTMVNWLDNIDLDPSIWSDIQRWKWNSDLPMEFSHAQDLGWPLNKISKVRESEKTEHMQDRHLWSEMWTIEDWKKFLKVNLPAFSGEWDERTEGLWQQLEEKMGGKTVQRRTIWPVVCVVATKRAGSTAAAISDNDSSQCGSPVSRA